MKIFRIIALFLVATTVVMAQDINSSEVPEAVTKAFNEEHPDAGDIEWERSMENYKVEFDIGRMEHEIWYSASGTVLQKEIEITEADLPQAIRDIINEKYPGYAVDDVEMKWQDNTTTYQVELEKGKEEWDIIFDSNGKILQELRD